MKEHEFLEDDESLPFDDEREEFQPEDETPKPLERKDSATDDEIIKVRREKEETERMLEEERARSFNAERMAIKSTLDTMKHNSGTLQGEISELKAALEVAKQENDPERIRLLVKTIEDKKEIRRNIVRDIDKYSPLLDQNFQPTAQKAAPSKTEAMQVLSERIPAFREWYSDNRNWVDDPLHNRKRQRAETLMEQFYNEGYDINSAKFFKAIDQKLNEEFDTNKGKRTVPTMRGEINGANNASVRKTHEDSHIERMAEKLTDRVMKDMKRPSGEWQTERGKRDKQRIFERNKELLKQHNVKSLNDIVWDVR